MQFFKALLTTSFLLLISLASTAIYAADKDTVQAIIPWDANGRVFQVDTRTMMFLGGTPPDRDPRTAPANHSNLVTFDESAMPIGVELYAQMALRHLGTE